MTGALSPWLSRYTIPPDSMLSFLSAEVIYGLLLVTTFVSVGLLGLWAATSRWHPFLRTTIALAILSVLLLRPMFEPLL